MPQYCLSSVGPDKQGLVAQLSGWIHQHQGNIDDSTMTLLGGQFATIILFTSPVRPDMLNSSLGHLEAETGLTVQLTESLAVVADTSSGIPTHLLQVSGTDKAGLTYLFSQALAQQSGNITDLTAQVIEGQDTLVYLMSIEFVFSGSDISELEKIVTTLANEHSVEAMIRPLEALAY